MIPASALMLAWMAALAGDAPSNARPPQESPPQETPPSPSAPGEVSPSLSEQFWPTAEMVDDLLSRWTQRMAATYELDAAQVRQVRDQVRTRWSGYLRERRAALQPLISEYLEARLRPEPPEAAAVRNWSERALPEFDRFFAQLRAMQQDVRPSLHPPQRFRFDIDNIKLNTAVAGFEATLRTWSRATTTPNEWWSSPSEEPAGRPGVQDEPPMRSASSAAKTRIDEELVRWERYAERFRIRYPLDEGQAAAAESVLRECRQRAQEHRDRFRARLEQLEKGVSTSTEPTPEQRAEAQALYGPVDALFVELSVRLEQIPTQAQRDAATSAEAGKAGSGDR